MDRINAIALLFLLKNDTSHFSSLEDYIKGFDAVVENIIGIDENINASEK